jgi:tetratricopeptide (TPR) repeat protein
MARFDHLELGGPNPEDPESAEPRLRQSHDERHWLKEADANRRKGQYENALRFYSRALEENKALVRGWLGQVQMLVLLDEVPEADTWARKSLELFPGNGELLASRAQAMCRLGDKRQGLSLSDASMAAPGNSAFRWQVRGEMMLATKQDIDVHCFDKAQQLDRDWLVPLESALIYAHYEVASKAQARARVAIEAAPDQFYCWYVYGGAQHALGLRRQAKESFEQCLKLSPRHVEATHRLETLRGGNFLMRTIRHLLGRG